jgi:hypothetical protein
VLCPTRQSTNTILPAATVASTKDVNVKRKSKKFKQPIEKKKMKEKIINREIDRQNVREINGDPAKANLAF